MRYKPFCPDHPRQLDPLYYRDRRGVFVRWKDKYLCQPSNTEPHVVDERELHVRHSWR